MKKIITVLLLMSSFMFGQVNILGVMDGPLSGGTPKFVELKVTQNSTDLTGWSLNNYNNGNTTISNSTTLSGTFNIGEFIYVIRSSDVDEFKTWFNLSDTEYNNLNVITGSSPNVNGDDALALSNGSTNIDVFGDIGTDGTGKTWEYLDGWAYGGNNITGTFTAANWTYSGTNALDGETTNSSAIKPYPSDNSALPVELTTFSASIVEQSVELSWETATEVNNYGFDVERRIEESKWTKLDFVNGHGNSNSPKYYSFVDNSIEGSGKYFYRLKQVDIDGTYEYSDVVEVNLGAPNNFELNQNFPNPFNPTTSIQFNLPQESEVKLTVFNVLGEEVAELLNNKISAGYHSISFNGSELNSGIYFYKLESSNYTQIRKMMLVK